MWSYQQVLLSELGSAVHLNLLVDDDAVDLLQHVHHGVFTAGVEHSLLY